LLGGVKKLRRAVRIPGNRFGLLFSVVVTKPDCGFVSEQGVEEVINVGRLCTGQCEVTVERGNPVFDRGVVFDTGVSSGADGFEAR
jgi:hypothetical protein